MSLPITRSTSLGKSSQVSSVIGWLVALGVVIVLAIEFGPSLIHAMRTVFVQVDAGGSKISNLGVDATFAAIVGVIVIAVGLAVRERKTEQQNDDDIHDVR